MDCVLEFGQGPFVRYVTMYVPGVEVLNVIVPVEALIESPAVLENVPPAKPVIIGVGLTPFTQYGEPA